MKNAEKNKLIAEFMDMPRDLRNRIQFHYYEKSKEHQIPVLCKIYKYLWENQGKIGYFDECLENINTDINTETRRDAIVDFIKFYNLNENNS
tara:strand:+ start:554 stop:829 length:276 start_codon:yes stop_codon:yes gene_type:complete